MPCTGIIYDMYNVNTADTRYEGESLRLENPARRGAGGMDGVPPSGHGLPEFAQQFNHDNGNSYTDMRVYATRATDHCKVTWGTRMRRQIYESFSRVRGTMLGHKWDLASLVCCVSIDDYDDMLLEQEFERDVRDAAHLAAHIEVEATGSREPISTRQLLEAQLAETGHPVNNIVYGDVLFEPLPAVVGETTRRVDVEDRVGMGFRPPSHPEMRTFWDTVTTTSEDASDYSSDPGEPEPDDSAELNQGSPDAGVQFNLLYPPIPSTEFGAPQVHVVTGPREARGLVLRQIVNGPRSAVAGRTRRKVRVRHRVVSPALVATMVAEVISRVGSLRDTPANRLVVERTALLRLREGEDNGDEARKWTPEAVAAYLPRVVHAYFVCNVHADGVGSGVRSMWVDFKSWFTLTDTLKRSPFIFE